MSIGKQTCYVLVCDGCQCPFEDDDEVVWHFESEGEAWDMAKSEDWTTDGKIHHCEGCSRNRPLTDANAEPEVLPVVPIPGQIPLGGNP